MFGFMSRASFILLILIDTISAEMCYDGSSYYFCSIGQTCGSYYGDCRGLPTYALVGIISLGIMLFSICLRCCIQINANNSRQSPISVQNPGTVPVYSHGNNLPTRSSTAVPIHNIREDAPPSYATATSTGLPKY